MAVFAPFEDASQLVRCCSCSVLRIGQRLILSRTGGRRVPGFVRAPGRGVIGVNGAAAKTSIVVIRIARCVHAALEFVGTLLVIRVGPANDSLARRICRPAQS